MYFDIPPIYFVFDSRFGTASIDGPSILVGEGGGELDDNMNVTTNRTIRKKTKVGLQFYFTVTTTIRYYLWFAVQKSLMMEKWLKVKTLGIFENRGWGLEDRGLWGVIKEKAYSLTNETKINNCLVVPFYPRLCVNNR